MIINKDAFDNSNFTLFSNEEYLNKDNNKEIKKVIKKYNITSEVAILTHNENNDYIFVMNHISHLYNHRKVLPEDLQNIVKYNIRFKKIMYSYIKQKLNELLINESTIFFKEIIILVNLLSTGKLYDIFNTYDNYNYENIGNLFRDQEETLRELYNLDKNSFDISFNLYTLLIDLFSKLCTINSIDIIRKATIRPIIDLLTETINMLKFSVTLKDVHIDKLNNILGQLLYYFSHMTYIDASNKQVNYLIDEYCLVLEKQRDGYNLSKDTHFGQEPDNIKKEFINFKSNSSYLLSTMIQKLKFTYEEEDYVDTRALNKIIELYNENFTLYTKEKQGIDSIIEFKDKLLDNFIYNYNFEDNHDNSAKNHVKVIDDFISSGNNYDPHNLEIIHNILLFSDKIEDYKYLNIGFILTESELLKNDYYEYFKLKTIDIIFNYFLRNSENEEFDTLMSEVFNYIDANRNASHLLSVYSKLYLSMVQYYSKKDNELSINKAKEIYSIFININGEVLLNNQYSFIKKDILSSLGNFYAKNLNLDTRWVKINQLIALGTEFSSMYFLHQELELKYQINNIFSQLNNDILFGRLIDSQEITKEISDQIANRLFYGLCAVYINGFKNEEAKITDNGYKHHSISLINNYEILFVFPAVYEDAFRRLLKKNKKFVQTNINNILESYTKNNSLYIDEVTGFANKLRLVKDLELFKSKAPILIEIYFGSLDLLYKQSGFQSGDKLLKTLANQIDKIIPTRTLYKISDRKMAILLEEEKPFNKIIKKILDLKITRNGKALDLNITITVSSSRKEDLIKDSFLTMDNAIKTKQDYLVNLK